MKKSKLSFGLVTGFIGVLALTACGEVTADPEAIASFKGYNGEQIKVLTDNVYNDYRDSASGVLPYYNAILDTLVRYQYQNSAFRQKATSLKSYDEIVTLAENKVKTDKENCEKDTSKSYKDAWEQLLKEKGCETEDDLKQFYILSLEKDELNDWLYKSNVASLEKEYIGLDDTDPASIKPVSSVATSQYPYSVRHILVNISGSATSFTQSTISEAEVTKLYTVMNKLTDDTLGYLFANVAKTDSQDTSSGAAYGDLGVVTPATDFINEFKLGIYAFDSILSEVNNPNDSKLSTIYDGLGLNAEVKNSGFGDGVKVKDVISNPAAGFLVGEKIQTVPYVVFEKLEEFKKITTDEKGNSVNDGKEVYYPRNILFNQYLNLHNPFVITNEKIPTSMTGDTTEWASSLTSTKRFHKIGQIEEPILCDELGRPIIGVRGSYGIHLMVVEKSIFSNTNNLNAEYITLSNPTDVVKKYSTNLFDFYGQAIPGDASFPTYEVDGNKYDKVTFVNASEEKLSKEAAITKADSLKANIKGFDPQYDYRLYETLIKDLNVQFSGTLKEDIAKYIANQRVTSKESSKKTLNDKWREYLELVEEQSIERQNGKLTYQLVPTTCAVSFKNHAEDDPNWKKGEMCNNATK